MLNILSFLEQIEHIDWHDHYVHLRSAAGIEFPGLFPFLTASDSVEAVILGILGRGCRLAVAVLLQFICLLLCRLIWLVVSHCSLLSVILTLGALALWTTEASSSFFLKALRLVD